MHLSLCGYSNLRLHQSAKRVISCTCDLSKNRSRDRICHMVLPQVFEGACRSSMLRRVLWREADARGDGYLGNGM